MRKALSVIILFAFMLPFSASAQLKQIAISQNHTVGLKTDGTVIAVGYNSAGQCNVSGWSDIIQVAAADGNTVGVKSDGTVVLAGCAGQIDVSILTNIKQIASGNSFLIALKNDGTVVTTGQGSPNVSSWSGIIQVGIWERQGLAYGVKTDGTVVTTYEGATPPLSTWTGIVQASARQDCIVGLKYDGTVLKEGGCSFPADSIAGWSDIVQVAVGDNHIVGLKSDGTVVAVGSNSHGECNVTDWSGIVQVAAGDGNTLGLKADGTVVAVGYNPQGQLNIVDLDNNGINDGYQNALESRLAAIEQALRNCGCDPSTLIQLSKFQAIPANQKVKLTWKTDSEISNAGFNVWRTEGFKKINPAMIPSQGSVTQGSEYEFLDLDVFNLKPYFYLLEDVDNNGISTFHGPVKAVPRAIYGSDN